MSENQKSGEKSKKKKKIILKIKGQGLKERVIEIPAGTNIMDALKEAGIDISKFKVALLNGRNLFKDGKFDENAVLEEDSALILTKAVRGGSRRNF